MFMQRQRARDKFFFIGIKHRSVRMYGTRCSKPCSSYSEKVQSSHIAPRSIGHSILPVGYDVKYDWGFLLQ